MKRLLILAHPAKNSFNRGVAEKIIQISEKNNIQIDFLDLYENPQEYLRFENQKEPEVEKQKTQIQKRIKNADELIFVYPIWWSDMPGILKNFFDQNFETGFAYNYISGEAIGLLEGKTARVFCSCGGEASLYEDYLPLQKMFSEGILGFCGIKTNGFKIFGNVRSSNDNEKYLNEIENLLS